MGSRGDPPASPGFGCGVHARAMRYTVGLPVELLVADPVETGPLLARLARTVEDAGFDAVSLTDHPFPPDAWIATGHGTIDILVGLTYAAAATTRLKLHTNLWVAPYRNPYDSAKSLGTLDLVSGGRLIVGLGVGYLRPEFEALGGDFEGRKEVLDESILAMQAAWTGTSVTRGGRFPVEGHTMLPRPAQLPHPPLWIGGNSKAAIRRAVEHAQGWMPFPTNPRQARYTGTAAIRDGRRPARADRIRPRARRRGRADGAARDLHGPVRHGDQRRRGQRIDDRRRRPRTRRARRDLDLDPVPCRDRRRLVCSGRRTGGSAVGRSAAGTAQSGVPVSNAWSR